MRKPGASAFVFALLLLSLSHSQARSSLFGPEPEDESDFNYIEGSGKGPEDWWHLQPGWGTCKFGDRQSPINLKDEDAKRRFGSDPPETYYVRHQAILKNRGHDIALVWPHGGGTLKIDGTEYTLKQCHWHSPSEHYINGKRASLEMHMVHESSDSKIAVIGVLYNIGSPDHFLCQLRGPLEALVNGQNNVTVGYVKPTKVNQQPANYYRYNGSLTTPPCTEGVVWTVLRQVRHVSHEQVRLLRKAVHDGYENNARPLQPTNGREIDLFQPYVGDEHPSS